MKRIPIEEAQRFTSPRLSLLAVQAILNTQLAADRKSVEDARESIVTNIAAYLPPHIAETLADHIIKLISKED
ncbi:MAG: hypothetical protein Q7R78_00095 [bacterium]|nr:hypothetical protein [bacterium]